MSIDGKRPDRVACLLAPASLPAKTLAALGEACLRFTPVVALREGEAVFLDITACGKLYSEERLRARLLALGRRFVPGAGACRVAIARDAATALALARFGLGGEDSAEAWRRLPLLALRDFASPFAGGGQEREAVKNVERILGLLAALGVRTLGDVAALPPASLAQRLGKDSVELSARLRGELGRAWPGFHPEPQLIERAEENAENVEAILFALKGPLDRAMARLRGRAQRALALEVGLGLEKWSVASEEARRSWRLDFPLPQGSTVGILPILRDRLTHELARKPLDAPVDSLWIEVLETAPGRGAQRDFFSAKEEEDEAVESLVARLLQKLGPSRAFTARPVDRYLPERAYERALETEAHGSAGGPPGPARPAPPRPTRLLGVPERIVARGELLQQPAVGKSWRVLAWEGPERLSGEWWREPFDRDYYRVATESGERLWVFRDRRDRRGASGGALYLHGYFD